MSITYFERWFWKRGQGIGPLSVDNARTRHNEGGAYIAVIEGKAIVDIAGKWTSVSFLDEKFRQYLRYDFEAAPGGLFVKGASHWRFDTLTSEVVEHVIFNFTPSGSYVAERALGRETVAVEGTVLVDVLWADQIDFGRYENVLSIERRVPLHTETSVLKNSESL